MKCESLFLSEDHIERRSCVPSYIVDSGNKNVILYFTSTVKPVLSSHSKRRPKMFLIPIVA